MYKRIFTIVIDSVGCGEAPDAAEYGDTGSNTIKHISEADGGIYLPNMEQLGYGHLTDIEGVKPIQNPKGNYTKMKEVSVGKDTLTGHWEIMGLKIEVPFQTFTDTGFPQELIDELEKRTGRKIVGNKASSGTVILDEFGEHQMKTGDLIVYTSSDSVLQIAAHEETVGLDELYKACEIARELTMAEKWKVGRIIARPYLGTKKGDFKRTSNRHDYALKPLEDTALVYLKEVGYDVISFGKINDIYDTEGITESIKQVSNEDGMNHFIDYADNDFVGLAYLNLVDFDALYGHRRDPIGYKKALEEFDVQLGVFMSKMREDDLLIITADHGNDPIAPGSDHTREYVPLLVYAKNLQGGELPVRETFADIGATISENFKTNHTKYGKSFLKELT
ncbi:MAG: phosphopentomutase [Firmicutes bacterium]|nr:phosphopentomutase [Bacillota bacterium]